MIYYENGSKTTNLSADDLKQGLFEALKKLGKKEKVLVVPPDYTRFPSRAGELTEFAWATGALATTFYTDYAQPADEEMVWSIWKGNARVKR